MSMNWLWQHDPMITATSPFLYIDWGDDEPGMTLQRRDGNDWVNYKVVKSPVDIDALPFGKYRLRT